MLANEAELRNGSYPESVKRGKSLKAGGLTLVRCVATGVSPLLMNAMDPDTLLGLWNGPAGKAAATKARPSPREAAEGKVHRLADGSPCVPGRMLYSALVAAGQHVRMDKKKQVSTAQKTMLPSMLLLATSDCPILVPGTSKPATWEVDIQQGRNPNGGEAVCIVRPRFDAWEIQFDIEIDQSVMPLPIAYDLVSKAGKVAGLGDFRPQRRGTFGRFVITKWEPEA